MGSYVMNKSYKTLLEKFTSYFVQQITYEKTRNDSYIRVNYNTVFNGHSYVTDECKRFYVTFNEEECTDPGPIDWVTYNEQRIDVTRSATSM